MVAMPAPQMSPTMNANAVESTVTSKPDTPAMLPDWASGRTRDLGHRARTPRKYDLADYVRHVDRYGPEFVLQVAASDLDGPALVQLQALIAATPARKRPVWARRARP